MKKIVTVVGARPQFIKASAVSRIVREHKTLREVLVHTGQHYDQNMSGVFFEQLGLSPPDYHLEIGSVPHGAQTGRMLESIEAVLVRERPNCVLVYGDTNSTLAASLAAAKLNIPVAHVEAGLRSRNRRMPEEINRIVTDHVSTLLFAPSIPAKQNLIGESIDPAKIFVVGDVMHDVSRQFAQRLDQPDKKLAQWGVTRGQFVLATIHRAENTDSPDTLRAIYEGLAQVAQTLPVLLPLHPRTQKKFNETRFAKDSGQSGLRIIEPLDYLEMALAESAACVIATDSGGVQKEAYYYRVPCVTLRTETEWTELIDHGWNRLADLSSAHSIASAVLKAISTHGTSVELFGDGTSANQIAGILDAQIGSS